MKGQKTGGRTQGTPNKVTQEMRGLLNKILQSELIEVPELLKQVSPFERIQMITKLLSFVLPRMQEVNLPDNGNDENRAWVDYTSLPPEVLKIVLEHTHYNNENDNSTSGPGDQTI